MQKEIARRLKLIRIASGFEGSRDFAEKLSEYSAIHEDTLGFYVRGERAIQQRYLIAIKRATGYPADYLLTGDKTNLSKTQKADLREAAQRLTTEEGPGRKARRRKST